MKIPSSAFTPDFEQLLKVLRREKADRPVLFEFIINLERCREAAGRHRMPEPGSPELYTMVMEAYGRMGYDYAPVFTWESDLMRFPKAVQSALASISQNEGTMISDRASFESYPWPDAGKSSYDLFEKLGRKLPEGMKLLGFSNGGILENATEIVGFENLCMMYLLDPELTGEIFGHIGSRLLTFYAIVSSFDSVGACVVNDDWGFKTQTIFPPEMMEKYVFPYTKKIIEVIHANGKPVIQHSCGNLKSIMDIIIDDLKVDGKHSFEDEIYPVEDAWKWWHKRLAIMGGIDMDFLVRKPEEDVYQRAIRLLELTSEDGAYALGSGNSIPDYVPAENHMAMIRAAIDFSS